MLFVMILHVKQSANKLSPSLYLSWPALGIHISHGRKDFSSSLELKVSKYVSSFCSHCEVIFCRPAKIPKSKVFPAVSCQPYAFGISLATLAIIYLSSFMTIHQVTI